LQLCPNSLGADTFNSARGFNGIPIKAILTDGDSWEFYTLNFNHWTVERGVGTAAEGFAWNRDYRITIPASERAPDYIFRLKTGTKGMKVTALIF
jgi:hypothetical protein